MNGKVESGIGNREAGNTSPIGRGRRDKVEPGEGFLRIESSPHPNPLPEGEGGFPDSILPIVIVGHVDHGKSTLIGRLFHDTGALPDGRLEQITQMCAKRGMPFEWSFLMDALQSERDQNVTIDTTRIWLRTPQRDYVIIDAPGHREFLKNMVTGAAGAEAALLLIDAEEGMKEQSRRHAYLLHLLGVKQVAVLINKMDKVGYDQARYEALTEEVTEYLSGLGFTPSPRGGGLGWGLKDTSSVPTSPPPILPPTGGGAITAIIPISAREGTMIATRGEPMAWYGGPTVLDALASFTSAASVEALPLRLPVQDVYKQDDKRIIAGRIVSGTLRVGDTLLLSPSNMTAKVKSIETFPAWDKQQAVAGESIGVTLEEQLFIERGFMLSHVTDAPLLASRFPARLFWLGHAPLIPGKRYRLRLATSEFQAELAAIRYVLDTDSLQRSDAPTLQRNQIGEVELKIRGLAAIDDFTRMPETGRFVLLEDGEIVGGGILSTDGMLDQRVAPKAVKSANVFAVEQKISPEQRAARNGHSGGILWFTGLSGAGKSTLALELQKRLFEKGYQVYVLDGDNIRQGLNSDLGFSPAERTENIRRVGEAAALFANAGMIVISAFISPYREDRKRARSAAPEHFHTVHIKADVATCEQRDTKGLYKKARAGTVLDFTGVSAPYEEPENPELVIDTMQHSVEECVAQLVAYVESQFDLGEKS